MQSMGSVDTLLIAMGNDSDVQVVEQHDGSYLVGWEFNDVEVDTLPETVLLLDTIQGQGARIPWRFMQDIAIRAISQLMEKRNDNLKAE